MSTIEFHDNLPRIGDPGKVWATRYEDGWGVFAMPVLPDGGLVESGLSCQEATTMVETLLFARKRDEALSEVDEILVTASGVSIGFIFRTSSMSVPTAGFDADRARGIIDFLFSHNEREIRGDQAARLLARVNDLLA